MNRVVDLLQVQRCSGIVATLFKALTSYLSRLRLRRCGVCGGPNLPAGLGRMPAYFVHTLTHTPSPYGSWNLFPFS